MPPPRRICPSLVTKLKRGRPDVVFHTGYNPDITLLLRQAREQGLKFGALVGHGAGYGVYEKLKEGLGGDVNYVFNTDPISIWLANQKSMDPKLPPIIKMVGEEFDKAKPGVAIRSAHVGMAASNTYVFMTEVLPRAIKKYGGVDPEALRKASLEVDLPEGGTMLGFGVKFYGEGQQMAGQNERSFPVVIQYVDDKSYVVWPKSQAQREAVLPLPKGTTFSSQYTVSGVAGVLTVNGLVKRFGGFTAVNNVSFRVEQGEILGLIGPNGSGKSTIFNMLSGTLVPTAGSILFDGAEIAGKSPRIASSTAASAAPSRSRGRFTGSASSRTWNWPATTARAAIAAPRPTRPPKRRFVWSA